MGQQSVVEQDARPTAGASAAGVLRPTTRQPSCDNLTATLLAGHDYRQVYFHERHHTSATILRTRRGSRSAACAGWAAYLCLSAHASKQASQSSVLGRNQSTGSDCDARDPQRSGVRHDSQRQNNCSAKYQPRVNPPLLCKRHGLRYASCHRSTIEGSPDAGYSEHCDET